MLWPAWLNLGTPLKFSLWLGNRLATWTGMALVWKRQRAKRSFRLWLWLMAGNAVSFIALAGALFWLAHRPARGPLFGMAQQHQSQEQQQGANRSTEHLLR